MRQNCTAWHTTVVVLALFGAAPVEAQDAAEDAPSSDADLATTDADAAVRTEDERASTQLSAPAEAEPPARTAEELSIEVPPASVQASPPPAPAAAESERPRYWRLPREGTRRPLTLPQAVMTFTSTTGVSAVPLGSGSAGRFTGFFGFGVGVLDDWELGTTPFGIVIIPPISLTDPSFYTRVRVLSGEVQLALRAEVSVPFSSQGAVWMGYGVELAWNPIDWFRFEANVEYGLQFLTPLQQTIYVPVRALFQAGPNTFSVGTGMVMYNDADDFDVPLIFRWAVAFAGYQGPLSEAALEGGVADLTDAERAWFFRGTWTFFAYP